MMDAEHAELVVRLRHWKHHPDGASPRAWAESVNAMRDAADLIEQLLKDKERVDLLQELKLVSFRPRNDNLAIAAIEMFTIQTQYIRGNTIREAIDITARIINDRS